MSYNPKKGMYKDDNGIARYLEGGTAPEPGRGKRWYMVEVIRRVIDSRGETVKRDKQRTAVFASEAEATGLGIRRCPDPWTGQDVGGSVSLNVYVRRLADDATLAV